MEEVLGYEEAGEGVFVARELCSIFIILFLYIYIYYYIHAFIYEPVRLRTEVISPK